MVSLLRGKPFSSFYQQKNQSLSDRTVNLIKEEDNSANQLADRLEKGEHILSILDNNSIGKNLTSIFQQDDFKRLKNEKLLNEKAEPLNNERLMEIQANKGGSSSLNLLQRAAKHFNLYQKAKTFLPEFNNRLFQEWKNHNRIYRPENNAKYPITDITGQEVRIKKLNSQSELTQSGISYDSEKIKPFFTSSTSPEERAALYDENLTVKPFESSYQKHPSESDLLNGNMVVARKPIPAKTCIGLYTGVWVPLEREGEIKDRTYTLLINSSNVLQDRETPPVAVIDGNGILSRMNTSLDYDGQGKPIQQAEDPQKYNVEPAYFKAELANGAKILLPAFFTTRPIAKNEELRWKYGLSPNQVKAKRW